MIYVVTGPSGWEGEGMAKARAINRSSNSGDVNNLSLMKRPSFCNSPLKDASGLNIGLFTEQW